MMRSERLISNDELDEDCEVCQGDELDKVSSLESQYSTESDNDEWR